MTKQELIEALNSKPHDAEMKFLDSDGHEVDVESMGFDLDLYVFQIKLDLNLPTEREILQDADSDEVLEILMERNDISTCCSCNIGWEFGNHTNCPLCELKEHIEYYLDKVAMAVGDLKYKGDL